MLATLAVTGSFLIISLTIAFVGRLLISPYRNEPPDGLRKQPALVLGPLTEAFAGVFPTLAKTKEKLKSELSQAGFYHRKAADEYLAMRNASMIAWMLFVGIWAAIIDGPLWAWRVLTIGSFVLVLIYGLPRIVLSTLAAKRKQRIQYALPDILDLINMMVSGGLPIQRAIHRVSVEVRSPYPDIACELAMIDRQSEAGTLVQALSQFADRIDIPDAVALSNLVSHAEKLGGNLATSLRDFADSIRHTRRQRAEERGNKTSVKLLFPIVFCLAPPIYVLLLGPAALELRNFVNRENRPGGVLSQDTSAASRNLTRSDESQPSEPSP